MLRTKSNPTKAHKHHLQKLNKILKFNNFPLPDSLVGSTSQMFGICQKTAYNGFQARASARARASYEKWLWEMPACKDCIGPSLI